MQLSSKKASPGKVKGFVAPTSIAWSTIKKAGTVGRIISCLLLAQPALPNTSTVVTMIAILFAALLATAAARPDNTPYGAASRSSSSDEVAILRDDRVAPSAAGEYSFDTETGDGIVRSESGYGSGPDGAVESQGNVKFTHPGGEEFELSFVANAEGGYQPESDALPVAPAFPFELPQFVLDQIEKAAREDAAKSNERPSYQ